MKSAVIILVGVLLQVSAQAVIIAGGDGTGNVTAPAGNESGWSYVGRLSNVPSSVTYLRDQWFITANHVKVLDNPSSVSLGGNTYSIVQNSWTRITNSTGTGADLTLFNPSFLSVGVSCCVATVGFSEALQSR